MKPKVSVLMPTYNDIEFIQSAIESVLTQVGVDIQLIVIDDGSDDGTDQFFQKIRDDRILYLQQQNSGQLNALFRASRYVTGQFVCLIHSDDLLRDQYSLQRNLNFVNRTNVDGCYSDILTMDERGKPSGRIFVPRSVKYDTVAKVLRTLGSNVIGDPFFVKKDAFFRSVLPNYVIWNMPYWFSVRKGKIETLKLAYIDEPWYVYRVYKGNYIRSDLGYFETFNGVARTIITLSEPIELRKIRLPYAPFLPGFLYGRTRKLKPSNERFCDLVSRQISKLLVSYLKTVPIDKVASTKYLQPYYSAVVNSFSLKSDIILEIKANDFRNFRPFYGKDARIFAKLLISGSAPSIIYKLVETAQQGTFSVICPQELLPVVRNLQKFLNLNFKIVPKR